MSKSFIIVGANFNNKGAQSMLFITIYELKKRFTDCKIYFATEEQYNENEYKFSRLYYSARAKKIALGDHVFFHEIGGFVKSIGKWILRKKNGMFLFNDVKNVIKEIDAIIDISGFNIGSKWSVDDQERYLDNIRLAKLYNISIFLMPQSFGDFNYTKEKEHLLSEISELFKYPKIIFAREKEGCQALKNEFNLNNVIYSTDLVLQNNGVDLFCIYNNIPEMILPTVKNNSVAIIPNYQCFHHGDSKSILQVYQILIEYLLEKDKNIYLIKHSREDGSICEKIAGQMKGANLNIINNDFSCFEYDLFVKRFEFIICSRFHGCVHAYRNYIPCILLGWAIKYKELAENVGQGQYAFDITANDFNADNVISAIDNMINNIDEESNQIKIHVNEIQKHNCFDQIEEWLNNE